MNSLLFAFDDFLGYLSAYSLDRALQSSDSCIKSERANDLRGWADLREVRTQVVFGRLIGQIAHEQSDWWHG